MQIYIELVKKKSIHFKIHNFKIELKTSSYDYETLVFCKSRLLELYHRKAHSFLPFYEAIVC